MLTKSDVVDAARQILLNSIWQCLRCPSCHASISWDGQPGSIPCPACRESYPVLPGGVPLLLVPARRERFSRVLSEEPGGKRMAEEYRRRGTRAAALREFFRPPSIVYDEDVARRYSWIYDTRGPDTIVLSVGGGPGRENPRVINLNVDAFDSVDIVGDGASIPLADASVDAVTCNAVIEHVPRPDHLISEMRRVLKPGGYLQLMVPFVFPFHEYPGDYQRYSASGILELTRDFEKVELCVLTGPTSALLVMFREYLRILVPGGNRKIFRTLLNGISGWATFPLKYIDRRLNRKPEAAHLAAAFYYLGRKPDA